MSARLAGRRVLVAEDNGVNMRLVQAFLKKCGIVCSGVRQGDSAVELFRTRQFDLLLMDCQMPGMDGYEASRRIRSYESEMGWSRTPIVALTAYAMQGDRERCLEAGMDDYLSKPVRLDALESMLLKWMDAGATGAPEGMPELMAQCSGVNGYTGSRSL